MEEPPLINSTAGPRTVRRNLRWWLLRTAIALFLLPVLLVLLSNLWLRSPWGRNWIAAKIENRIGLKTSIGSASWSPGGQFSIKNLRIAQPSALSQPSDPNAQSHRDLASVKEISIQPVWRELLRGKRDITSVTIDGPELHIPIELLATLAARQQPTAAPTVTTPPTIAQQAPQIPEKTSAIAASQVPAIAVPPSTEPTPPIANNGTKEPLENKPTGMFYVKNAQLELFHAGSNTSLSRSRNLVCSIPFEGNQAKGSITVDSIEILNQPVGKNINIPLTWKSPVLETPILPLEIAGFSLEIRAQLAKLPGLPFSLGIQQKQQTWQSPALNSSQPYFASADEVESLHRATGLLLAPMTWSGESIAQARHVHVRTLGGQRQDFFQIRQRLILAQSSLHCVEFRALGDDTALLANGTLHGNGTFSLSNRFLASRRHADAIEERIHGNFPELTVKLVPLYNEDRRVIDFLLGGSISQPWISADQGKHLLDLKKMISLWNTRNTDRKP